MNSYYLEYGCICVLIYSDNDFGVSHACQVLNSPGNTKRHIQLWSYNLPSLPNLKDKLENFENNIYSSLNGSGHLFKWCVLLVQQIIVEVDCNRFSFKQPV